MACEGLMQEQSSNIDISDNEQTFESPCNINEQAIDDENVSIGSNDTFIDSDIEDPLEYEVGQSEFSLKESLAAAFIEAELGMNQIDIILRAIHLYHPEIPLSYTTLLDTPETGEIQVQPMTGGEYIGFDLKTDLQMLLMEQPIERFTLNINIDGVPVAKSTQWQFCVITCYVKELDQTFISGVYHGRHKPVDQDEFVKPFVAQLNYLMNNGLEYLGRNTPVILNNAVLDAIGRAPLLKIKHPSGFHSCHQCKVRGEKLHLPPRKILGRKGTHKMSFEPERCEARTDEEFRAKIQFDHKNGKPTKESHHMSMTACEFEKLNIDIVQCFAIDYMHCALLGVGREMIKIWSDLISNFQRNFDENLNQLRSAIPCEFQRKCRESGETWKANEVRLFVNYISCIALKDVLPDDLFEHFLKFTCSIRIMCSRELISNLDVAEQLMHDFVMEFRAKYPSEPITYNLHSCDHLAQNCRNNDGTLDDFSAFFGENQLQILKRWYKTGRYPLIQIGRRCLERKAFGKKYRKPRNKTPEPRGRIQGTTNRFKRLICEKFTLAIDRPNNAIYTEEEIMEITAITTNVSDESEEIFLEGRCTEFTAFDDIFSDPVSSKCIGMYKMTNDVFETQNTIRKLPMDVILGKCIMYKDSGFTYVIKQLHW